MDRDGKLNVYADRRWPAASGIGVVQAELEKRLPADMDLIDIGAGGRIGSPLSPVNVARALARSARDGDGVFYSAGFIPPLWSRLPKVVIVHDLMHRRFYGTAKRAYYDRVLRPLYRRCTAFVCVSEFTRGEFLEWSGLAPERVHVMNIMCSEAFRPDVDPLKLGYDYVTYCGNHRSYKNLDRLIRAYATSRLPKSGIRLVLTGEVDVGLAATARECGVGERLVFLGMLPAADVPRLYRGALAVVYVSLMEGFGLPILEAFATGVPLVTSNVAAMPEVAGDAAFLVDPFSVDAIRDGLDRVTEDATLRALLVERGFERLKDFGWDVAAERLWKIVRDAARRPV